MTPTQAGANTLIFSANDGTTTSTDTRSLYLTPAVTGPNALLLTLQPGQYAVYTSRKITHATTAVLPTKAPREAGSLALSAAPNPAGTRATLHYTLSAAAPVQNLTNGLYLLRLRAGAQQQTTKLVVQH